MPKYNLVHAGGRAAPYIGTIAEAAAAETAAEAVESLALTDTGSTPHWTYSATAEDNGTAGALDGTPGVIYNGAITTAQRVNARVALSAGTIAPEAADDMALGIYKNSTLVATFDNETVAGEFVFDELDSETIQAQIDTVVDAVVNGDVIRVGLIGLGEETVDVDVAPGQISIG